MLRESATGVHFPGELLMEVPESQIYESCVRRTKTRGPKTRGDRSFRVKNFLGIFCAENSQKACFGNVKWPFTWYHVANPSGAIALQTAPFADKCDRGVFVTRPVIMMSFISSCRNKTVAGSVTSPAPDSRPSVSAVAEIEKETAPSMATKRGGGEASTQSLALGGAQRGDKGVWGGPVSLSELAFEMEMEPELEREPPRSKV